MNIVQKWARQVAAIDESVLTECPEADRNWANHIGYALMLTFVVVFGLVFYSLLTIDGVKVVYDVQTNAVKMDSNSHELWSYVGFGVVATVVALVIFFFDRAFYQSDWFAHAPYAQEMSLWQKVKTLFSKVSRMSVRIGISLILAFALSTFAELKFYESELLTTMQKQYLQENKAQYAKLKQTLQKLDDEVPTLRQEEATLLKKLQNLENGIVSMDDEPAIQKLDVKYKALEQAHEAKLQALKQTYLQEIARLTEEKKPLESKLESLTQAYNSEENLYHAEVNGIKEIEVGGTLIKASGIPSEGRRAKMHKARMGQIAREMHQIQSKLAPIEADVKQREREYSHAKAEAESALHEEKKQIEKQKKRYFTQLQHNLQANAVQMKSQYATQLKRVQARLEKLTLHKEELVENEHKKMMQSPEYIPFRDGPMSRVMALENLKDDEKHGDDIAIVSWIVRGFIIFLEAIPVFSKMWFGPQTLYATLLQVRLKRMTQEAIDNEGMTLGDIEKAIALEKKKQELQEVRLKTWHKEAFNEEYRQSVQQEMHKAMHDFDMNIQKNNKEQAA